MKTYLTFGAAMAGGGFVIVLVLYILGFHSDPAKLGSAQWIQGCLGLGVSISCIVLGTKARRAQVPPTEPFGYGRALGTGVMITLFAALVGLATTYLYGGVINPHFTDVIIQSQADKLEAQGLSAEKIEQIQKMSAPFMKLPAQMVFGFCGGMIFGTIISLISSAFLKRPASDELQPVS
jgi:hypothetical protein